MFDTTAEEKQYIKKTNSVYKNIVEDNEKEKERINESWLPFGSLVNAFCKNSVDDYSLHNRNVEVKEYYRKDVIYYSEKLNLYITSAYQMWIDDHPISIQIYKEYKQKGWKSKSNFVCICEYSYNPNKKKFHLSSFNDSLYPQIEQLFQEMKTVYTQRLEQKTHKVQTATEASKLIYPKFGGEW